jgi:hypothetical protein
VLMMHNDFQGIKPCLYKAQVVRDIEEGKELLRNFSVI